MNDLLKAALEYKQAGLSIVAVKDNKKCIHYWRKYQYEIMSDDLIIETFSDSEVKGIAIVCGCISGNLEVLDMDSKYDLTGTLFNRFCESLSQESHELYKLLPIARTKNNGYHFFYRCTEMGSYTALAKRNCTDTEKMHNPKEKSKVLIEVQAKGEYVVVFPTMDYCFIQHDLKNIPHIAPNEKKLLYKIASAFNEYSEPKLKVVHTPMHYYDPESPFDDYNIRGDVISLLQLHGWKVVGTTPIKTYFRRPGNTDHDTSGDYNHELRLFGVFTPNTEFERGKGYKPYAVYAILECNGDFRLAAKRLIKEGYGIAYKNRR